MGKALKKSYRKKRKETFLQNYQDWSSLFFFFFKPMNETKNLLESRLGISIQDKRFSEVPAKFGEDTATPRLGNLSSACSGSGAKSLPSTGMFVFIQLHSQMCFGRTIVCLNGNSSVLNKLKFHGPHPSEYIFGAPSFIRLLFINPDTDSPFLKNTAHWTIFLNIFILFPTPYVKLDLTSENPSQLCFLSHSLWETEK